MTREGGELNPWRTRRRKGRSRDMEPMMGNTKEAPTSQSVNETASDSGTKRVRDELPQRIHVPRSRMREICTSGSEGGRAGNRSAYPTGFSCPRFPVVFAPPRVSRPLPHPVRRSTTGYFPPRPPAWLFAVVSPHTLNAPMWTLISGKLY
jgi:hypothetical protein